MPPARRALAPWPHDTLTPLPRAPPLPLPLPLLPSSRPLPLPLSPLPCLPSLLSVWVGSAWGSCGGVLCPGRVFPPPPLLPLPLRSSVPFLASPCLVFLLLLHTRPRSAHVAAPSPISGFFSLQACAGDGLIFVFLLLPCNSIGASACGIFTRGYLNDMFSPVKVTFCFFATI